MLNLNETTTLDIFETDMICQENDRTVLCSEQRIYKV